MVKQHQTQPLENQINFNEQMFKTVFSLKCWQPVHRSTSSHECCLAANCCCSASCWSAAWVCAHGRYSTFQRNTWVQNCLNISACSKTDLSFCKWCTCMCVFELRYCVSVIQLRSRSSSIHDGALCFQNNNNNVSSLCITSGPLN
jgi:hypothetical protein